MMYEIAMNANKGGENEHPRSMKEKDCCPLASIPTDILPECRPQLALRVSFVYGSSAISESQGIDLVALQTELNRILLVESTDALSLKLTRVYDTIDRLLRRTEPQTTCKRTQLEESLCDSGGESQFIYRANCFVRIATSPPRTTIFFPSIRLPTSTELTSETDLSIFRFCDTLTKDQDSKHGVGSTKSLRPLLIMTTIAIEKRTPNSDKIHAGLAVHGFSESQFRSAPTWTRTCGIIERSDSDMMLTKKRQGKRSEKDLSKAEIFRRIFESTDDDDEDYFGK